MKSEVSVVELAALVASLLLSTLSSTCQRRKGKIAATVDGTLRYFNGQETWYVDETHAPMSLTYL